MGKGNRLHNKVEPFAALFWAPYIVGSIIKEDALLPPLFLSRYIIYLPEVISSHVYKLEVSSKLSYCNIEGSPNKISK